VDLEETTASVEKRLGRKVTRDEVLSYLLYPEVFLKFARAHQAQGDMEILPTPQFFYGMERGHEIAVDLEPGKTLVVKFLTVGEPHPEGYRTVFFELNGQPRTVRVENRRVVAKVKKQAKADPGNPAHVGAPMPGVVSSVTVSAGQSVKPGDQLLTMEAMKMQTGITADREGVIKAIHAAAGTQVDAKDLLIEYEA